MTFSHRKRSYMGGEFYPVKLSEHGEVADRARME